MTKSKKNQHSETGHPSPPVPGTDAPSVRGATGVDSDAGLRPDRLGAELRPDRLGARLRPDRLGVLAREVPAWRLSADQALLRTWSFGDATTAACFARFVAALTEAAGNPAVIRQHGGRVSVRITTPRVGGLTVADFHLARQLGARG